MARLRRKRVRTTKEQEKLYKELERLVRQANKRITSIENLTGTKEAFAGKELYDYLSVSNVNVIGKRGIEITKGMKINRMLAIKKAVQEFLEDKASTVQGMKELVDRYTKKAGVPISYKMAKIYYQAGKHYTWIYNEKNMNESKFWKLVQVAQHNNWDMETWVDQISIMIEREVDEELRKDLEALYLYVMGE